MSLAKTIGGFLGVLREAHVESAADVAPGFRKVTLAGAALRDRPFKLGDKVQLILEGGARTYTPLYETDGRMTILVHLHDDTPGALFGKNAKADAPIHVFGPRGSLDFPRIKTPAVFFGDETSIAAAAAFARCQAPHVILEATDVQATRAACEAMGIHPGSIIERSANEAHLATVATQIRAALPSYPALVMTGKAQSIQALQRTLKADGIWPAERYTKAYWSVGRKGLD